MGAKPEMIVAIAAAKEAIPLFGGAIEDSVSEALSTVIDMQGCKGGTLDIVRNTGSGTFSLAVMVSDIATGVFHQAYLQKDDGTVVVYPPLLSIASTSTAQKIGRIPGRYLKLVPTISGTVNATFEFVPELN